MFAKALRLDDRFALAWAETAQVHVVLGLYFEPSTTHMPIAREAAQRALQLDDSLQAAHASLAIIHLAYDWDYTATERELASAAVCRRAILNFTCAAHLFAQTGRGRDAEGLIRNTLTFDPRNPTLVSELGCNNYYRRRYEQAIDHFRDAKELDSEAPFAYWGMGRAYGQMKRYDEALAILREFKDRAGFEPPILTAEIGYVLGLSGCRQEALEIVRQLEDASRTMMYVNPYLISLVWLGIGDLDQTFAWLEKAYREKSAFVISIPSEPKWQPVRNDPRFQSVLERIGFYAR
jgi:pentatricopeptide repeat protein